jgi:hypothetical protein
MDQKIIDLSKKKSNLQFSALSVAKEPKFLACKPPKALLSVAKGSCESLPKPLKALF